MLEKDMYDSWKSRMELYMLNRPYGRMILESVEQCPLIWPSVEVEGVTRLKKYSYSSHHFIANCFIAGNIKGEWRYLFSTEPQFITTCSYPTIKTSATLMYSNKKKYSELSAAEAIQADCDVKATNIILQGLPSEERECKLYDAFDKFAYQKGETLRDFYLRFSLLLNNMNMYNMKLEQFQVNTKFLNTLPFELSKFVTDVKLVRDLHTTNVDQLHVYLGQHEYHANEVRLMNGLPTSVEQDTLSTSSVEYSPPEAGLVVPVFHKGDDPIDAINHMMSFLTSVVASRYPATNNQL
nr:hypothetical protein [Tanacetum cinerariifolium]